MIVSVGNQSGAVKRRLVDMGLTPGTVVKVTKIAPLGDPLEVSLRGYELARSRPGRRRPPSPAPRTRSGTAASFGTTSTSWSTTRSPMTTTPTTPAP